MQMARELARSVVAALARVDAGADWSSSAGRPWLTGTRHHGPPRVELSQRWRERVPLHGMMAGLWPPFRGPRPPTPPTLFRRQILRQSSSDRRSSHPSCRNRGWSGRPPKQPRRSKPVPPRPGSASMGSLRLEGCCNSWHLRGVGIPVVASGKAPSGASSKGRHHLGRPLPTCICAEHHGQDLRLRGPQRYRDDFVRAVCSVYVGIASGCPDNTTHCFGNGVNADLVAPRVLLCRPHLRPCPGQRRLDGIDQIVLSLTARGLTTGEVAAHFAEVYGAKVSKDTISRITEKVIEEMAEWQHRPLDRVYPVIFIDAIVVKVRDGQVTNEPFYVVIGVTTAGERDILGHLGRRRRRGSEVLAQRADRDQEPWRRGRAASRSATAEGAARGDHHRLGRTPRSRPV